MNDFRSRKAERTAYYMKYIHGRRMIKCGACNGSGHYDHFIRGRIPKCSSCEGTGKCQESDWEMKERLTTTHSVV